MDDDRGAKIREARQAKQMTQEQLAAACGVKMRTIARWETGELVPAGDRLTMLRIVLDTDV